MDKIFSKLEKIPVYVETLIQLFIAELFTDSVYKKRARDGYSRGIDFYSQLDFYRILANARLTYKKIHNIYPNIVHPKGFNEKIFWFKFFGEFKTPEAGNKLLTAHFIPLKIQHLISCPKILWQSANAKLPSNHELPSGTYYLKANHGSGMFKKIQYPLSEAELVILEDICAEWLMTPYGLGDGEWWYNAFNKEILIEESVTNNAYPISWDFFIFGNKLAYISMIKKMNEEVQITWLDKDFSVLSYQPQGYPSVDEYELPKNIDLIKELALQIGAQFNFVRVDLLIGDNDQIYLGEITFSPGNAHTVRPQEMDKSLGDMWKI